MGQYSALHGVLAHGVERGVMRGAHRPAPTYKPPYGLKHSWRDARNPNSGRPAGTSFSACWRRGAKVRIGAGAIKHAQRFGPLVPEHQADEEWKDEHGLPLGFVSLGEDLGQSLDLRCPESDGDRLGALGKACADLRREGSDDLANYLHQLVVWS